MKKDKKDTAKDRKKLEKLQKVKEIKEVVKEEKEVKKEENSSAKKKIIILLLGIGVAVILYFAYLLLFVKGTESTQNAYIHGNKVTITSQVKGVVNQVNVVSTEKVEENQILIKLDKTDYEIAYENAKATLGEGIREYYYLQNTIDEARAELKKAKSYVDLMENTLKRAKASKEIGVISVEDFDNINFQYINSKSNYEIAKLNYKNAKIQGESKSILTHPKVAMAIENLRNSYYNLKRLEIISPIEGTIAEKQVAIGEAVGVGQTLITMVDLKNVWVEANFKETQLKNIKIGNPVKIQSDVSEKTYKGVVVGISPGSGNAFSLIPSQNATGNWIKIVQRVPVRIEFLEEVEGIPLETTLTVEVNTKEKIQIPKKEIGEKSSLYEINKKKFNDVLESVIKENTI